MIFHELSVPGAYQIDIEPLADERGFFARSWCCREFVARGLVAEWAQASLVVSPVRGTLRGLHFQAAPHEEAKLVRCTHGAAFVVALDLRPDSFTYLRHVAVELSADNRRSFYVPTGCAQGYQTLLDDTEMNYQMSTAYAPSAARGLRFDDRTFTINWPLAVSIISKRDRTWPDFVPAPGGRGEPVAPPRTDGATPSRSGNVPALFPLLDATGAQAQPTR